MYKILVSISRYIIYNEVELQKYLLTCELPLIMENLPYKCGNLPNCTILNRYNIC